MHDLITKILVFVGLISPAPLRAECSHAMVRVGIIDTGLDLQDPRFTDHLCPTGHLNFVKDLKNPKKDVTKELKDTNAHGTHIAGLIRAYAGESPNYCLVIYKYYSDKSPDKDNISNLVAAMQAAVDAKLDFVNISGGGGGFQEPEFLVIRGNPDTKFIVAAGNGSPDGQPGENLDEEKNKYYPASYNLPNEIVVGSIDEHGKRATTSNFGSIVKIWEVGVNVKSTVPQNFAATGVGYLSGTSQATAVHTGKEVAKVLATHVSSCDIR